MADVIIYRNKSVESRNKMKKKEKGNMWLCSSFVAVIQKWKRK